jgi:hypothetical protein
VPLFRQTGSYGDDTFPPLIFSDRGSVAQNENSPVPVPARRGGGCFTGCIALVLVIAIGIGSLIAYNGWFFATGYKNDPNLQSALTTVRANTIAHAVLGDGIAIESMQSETLTAVTGHGKTVAYTVRLKGSRAEGSLHVMLHSTGNGQMKIVSMVLTGPDNERYNLTSSGNNPTPSNSI